MKNRKIILASKSPRRKMLLEQMGLKNFAIRESKYKEDMKAYKDPYVLAQHLALKKCEEVASHYNNAIIIAADTFVVYKNKFLGKPKTKVKAREMLKHISNRKVKVITGLAVIDTERNISINSSSECLVDFKKITDEEIKDYIKTGEPLDRAGAFAAQERACVLIKGFEGDYDAMVGLPTYQLYLILKKLGVDCLKI